MKYKRIRFPDNQISAEVTDFTGPYEIKERINSYEDLFFIKALADVLHHNGYDIVHLTIPCLFGQRSDLRFTENQSFDLGLIADVINSCNFTSVSILDPHSAISLALIKNSKGLGVESYVSDVLYDIERSFLTPNEDKITLVSPDAGAYKKVFKLASDFEAPLVAAVKFRDLKGNISLNFTGDVKGKNCLIVDDLCSRGGTFIQLAQQLKDAGCEKIFLYITHFEGGCSEYKQTINNLRKVIDWVYITNSFRDFDSIDEGCLTVFKVI